MWDAIVIGGGLAGYFAGIRAAERGKKVLLVTEGVGTMFLFSGVISYGDVDRLRLLPGHPYQTLSTETIKKGREFIRQICPDYVDSGRPEKALSPLGLLRSGDLLPRRMKVPEPAAVENVVVLAPQYLKDFFPEVFAANLSAVFPNAHIQVEELTVEDFQTWSEYGRPVTGVDYADYWRTPKGQRLLELEIEKIRQRISSSEGRSHEEGTLVLVPGLVTEYWDEGRHEKAAWSFSLPVLEVSSFPPSPHGRYLAEYLRRYFQDCGGEVMLGAKAVGGKLDTVADGKRSCHELVVQSKGKELLLPGKEFILATGGLLGAGLEATSERREIREKVFDLPVYVPDKWSSPDFLDEQPYALAGIATDQDLHPLNPLTGEIVLENVRVVGRTLAHWDPWTQGCGAGVSITSGFAAGESV